MAPNPLTTNTKSATVQGTSDTHQLVTNYRTMSESAQKRKLVNFFGGGGVAPKMSLRGCCAISAFLIFLV